MNSTAHAINKQNMMAISVLRNGDTGNAINSFRATLGNLREGLPNNYHMKHAEECFPSPSSSQQPCVQSVSLVHNEETLIKQLTSSKSLFDFFPRAFDMVDSRCFSDHKRCSVVLMYNMALAMDFRAVLMDEDPVAVAAWQARAIQLYRSALECARKHWDHSDRTALKCVLLAILNNLGRLQSLALCFQETRYCLRMAVKILKSPGTYEQVQPHDYFLLGNSVGPFYLLEQDLLPVAPCA